MIALGSDHAGYELKEQIKKHLTEQGLAVKDYGTYSEESCDYPVYAKAASEGVLSGECECGILVCGTGIGISMVANKQKGIRCAHCTDPLSAALAKQHNNANMIALGGRITGSELAFSIVDAYLNAEFLGGKHLRRINMFE